MLICTLVLPEFRHLAFCRKLNDYNSFGQFDVTSFGFNIPVYRAVGRLPVKLIASLGYSDLSYCK